MLELSKNSQAILVHAVELGVQAGVHVVKVVVDLRNVGRQLVLDALQLAQQHLAVVFQDEHALALSLQIQLPDSYAAWDVLVCCSRSSRPRR